MKLNRLNKISGKAVLIMLLLNFFFMQAQKQAQSAERTAVGYTTLPFVVPNACLDQTVAVSPGPVIAARNMVVRDFDNDLLDDVALYDTVSKNLIIYHSNGTGFTPVTLLSYNGLTRFHSISAGDFDGDSDFDLAICFTDSLRILCNNGALNFTQGFYLNYDPASSSAAPYMMKAGKLNGDNTDDIAIVSARAGAGGVQVMAIRCLPVGANTFSLVEDLNTPISTGPQLSVKDTLSITLGDFDSGNFNEIIISNKQLINLMYILKNTTAGAGALAFSITPVNTAAMVPVGSPSVNIIKGESIDVDGDGITEFFALARAFVGGGLPFFGFAYFPGATNAATLANIQLPTGVLLYQFIPISNYSEMPVDFTVGDINGDGKKDLIGINNNNLIIFPYDPVAPNLNKPYTINYSVSITLPGPNMLPEEVALGHFDPNKIPDIFFKPWRSLPGAEVGVIPNYSYSISTTGDSVVCPGKTATVSIKVYPQGGSLPPQHLVNWFEQPGGYVTTGSVATIVNPGHYYPYLGLIMPVSGQTCAIRITGGDTIIIQPKPGPPLTLTPVSYSACPGGTIAASITSSNVAAYAWVAPGGNTISATSSMISNPINSSGIYTVFVSDAAGCMSSATLTADNFSVMPLSFSATKGSICPGDSNLITVMGGLPGSYRWSVQGDTLLSTSNTVSVKPSATTQYSVNALDLNGCPTKDAVNAVVDMQCAIKIYNAVTFNGDQDNSVWIIDNIERYPKNKVSIFSRWGTRIASIEGYNNKDQSWPDEGRDKNLPASTYFYVLDLGDGSALMKGWIELIKK